MKKIVVTLTLALAFAVGCGAGTPPTPVKVEFGEHEPSGWEWDEGKLKWDAEEWDLHLADGREIDVNETTFQRCPKGSYYPTCESGS